MLVGCALRAGVHYEAVHVNLRRLQLDPRSRDVMAYHYL